MIVYHGLFMDEKSVKLLRQHEEKPLQRSVKNTHITFEYLPIGLPPEALLGNTFSVKVVGYGSDQNNSGFCVELSNQLLHSYEGAPVPHITTSLSLKGKAVRTAFLPFHPIEPFFVSGRYGFFNDKDGEIHYILNGSEAM